MKKLFKCLPLLALCLVLCGCVHIQATFADAMEDFYGIDEKTYEEHLAYYQKDWDELSEAYEKLFNMAAEEAKEYAEEAIEDALQELATEPANDRLLPDNAVDSYKDRKNRTIPMYNYQDENGNTVPILHDFPNAVTSDVALTEYPINDYFPDKRSDPVTIENQEYPSTYNELGATQCLAYARYIQRKLYHVDEYNNPECFAEIPGSDIDPGKLTTEKCKELITQAGEGAHLRTKGSQHSMVVAYVDENGFAVIDSNGTGEAYKNDLRYYTWEEYCSSYGTRGFDYIKVYQP